MAPAPISPYGLQKLAGETYVLLYHRLYGLPTVAFRYFNVFGPRQDPGSDYSAVIPLFVTAALGGRRPTQLDAMHRWDLEFEFGEERVLANWDYMQNRWNDELREVWRLNSVTIEGLPGLFERYVGDLIQRHPAVRFDLLLLPTSMLDYSNDFQISPDRFDKRLALREATARLAAEMGNVVLWDFQLVAHMSEDLGRYKDLEHFDLGIAREILASITAEKHQVDPAQLRRNSEALGRAVAAWTEEFCSRGPEACQPVMVNNLKNLK